MGFSHHYQHWHCVIRRRKSCMTSFFYYLSFVLLGCKVIITMCVHCGWCGNPVATHCSLRRTSAHIGSGSAQGMGACGTRRTKPSLLLQYEYPISPSNSCRIYLHPIHCLTHPPPFATSSFSLTPMVWWISLRQTPSSYASLTESSFLSQARRLSSINLSICLSIYHLASSATARFRPTSSGFSALFFCENDLHTNDIL
jgi:hypothetical protein